jgi:membrane protease YdiL (CAAX protease family)
MRKTLNLLGFSQHLLLPILTVALLLGWHHIGRRRWRVPAGVLPGMLAECLLLAIALRMILQLQKGLFGLVSGPSTASLADKCKQVAGGLIGYLGAGIYEELLFRLILLTLVLWLLYRLGVSGRKSILIGVIATSLLFAVAHYVGPYGEQLQTFSFVFRFVAGVFFSILFLPRLRNCRRDTCFLRHPGEPVVVAADACRFLLRLASRPTTQRRCCRVRCVRILRTR